MTPSEAILIRDALAPSISFQRVHEAMAELRVQLQHERDLNAELLAALKGALTVAARAVERTESEAR